MKKRQFLHAGSSAFAIFAAFKSTEASGSGGQSKKLSVSEGLDPGLSDFLEQTEENRRRVFQGYKKPDIETRISIAEHMEEVAIGIFETKAANGSRRDQFYLGKIYQELHGLTKNKRFLDAGQELLIAAEAQGHPDAVYYQIKSFPNRENRALYIKAIRLGSVSALASCSGATQARFDSKNWMKIGPLLSFPEQVGFEWWSEVFENWMIIYHFLVQWDPTGVNFRLSLPNWKVLEIVSGQHEVEEAYREKFGWDFMRERADAAATHASGINIDLRPEEIYRDVWDKMFRFSMQWHSNH